MDATATPGPAGTGRRSFGFWTVLVVVFVASALAGAWKGLRYAGVGPHACLLLSEPGAPDQDAVAAAYERSWGQRPAMEPMHEGASLRLGAADCGVVARWHRASVPAKVLEDAFKLQPWLTPESLAAARAHRGYVIVEAVGHDAEGRARAERLVRALAALRDVPRVVGLLNPEAVSYEPLPSTAPATSPPSLDTAALFRSLVSLGQMGDGSVRVARTLGMSQFGLPDLEVPYSATSGRDAYFADLITRIACAMIDGKLTLQVGSEVSLGGDGARYMVAALRPPARKGPGRHGSLGLKPPGYGDRGAIPWGSTTPYAFAGGQVQVPPWTQEADDPTPFKGVVAFVAPQDPHVRLRLTWGYYWEAPTEAFFLNLGARLARGDVQLGELPDLLERGSQLPESREPTSIQSHPAVVVTFGDPAGKEPCGASCGWYCERTKRMFMLAAVGPPEVAGELTMAFDRMLSTIRCHARPEGMGLEQLERLEVKVDAGWRVEPLGGGRVTVRASDGPAAFTLAWLPDPGPKGDREDFTRASAEATAHALGIEATELRLERRHVARLDHPCWTASGWTDAASTAGPAAFSMASWRCPGSGKRYQVIQHPSSAAPTTPLTSFLEHLSCH